jgi:hypothetical protein
MRCLGGGISMTDVVMTIRNPLDHRDMIPVYIKLNDTELAFDWLLALQQEIIRKSHLEKNYCWHGWPGTQRNLRYLCDQMNRHVEKVNAGLNIPYDHIDYVDHTTVMIPFTGINEPGKQGGGVNHDVMNLIHNHFEHLQGTVENLSPYYKTADPETKYSIRQLNNLCHEIETLCLSLRKEHYQPDWVRPSQITTFLNAKRHTLSSKHREGFIKNGYDRRFAHVYMHWTQIGKTLMEVFSDEGAPHLDAATCDAITHLQYYSGEFDVEWGQNVCYGKQSWHTRKIDEFNAWLKREGYDPEDPKLSLGYLELGHVDLERSFGTHDMFKIWEMMSRRLDIYSLTVGDDTAVYDYSWADPDYEERQIRYLMPGYLSHA